MSDADLKLALIIILVPFVFGIFSALFVSSQIPQTDSTLSFTNLISVSWDILRDYPELATINIMLISFSAIGGIILLARYIRGV